MSSILSLPRGTSDVIPDEIGIWRSVEDTARQIFVSFNYREIRTPIFEETELFARSMGQTSDVVQKQMLNLAAQKTSEEALSLSGLSLRPENTASVVRCYIENNLDKKAALSKLFYIGPMFRGERPQKGRLRQFYQMGVEVIGPDAFSPLLDAEAIALSVRIVEASGIKNFKLRINTLGSAGDKEAFSRLLREKIFSQLHDLCNDCRDRFERNVFRILDCKNEACRCVVASISLDHSYLSQESRAYYEDVKTALTQLNVKFEESLGLVRGLDYYTHTVFEISCPDLGSQDALGAGGRYNTLVAQLGGGEEIGAVGFALGMERMIFALGQEYKNSNGKPLVYCLALDAVSLTEIFVLADSLRRDGIATDMAYKVASMKSLMRSADKSGAQFVVLMGENERLAGKIAVKDFATGKQETINKTDLVDFLKIKN